MTNKNDFTYNSYGWDLKKSGKFFLNKEVSISVDTKSDSDHPDREIFDDQIETLKIINNKWEEFAIIIEKEILAYEKIPKKEFLKIFDNPHIWLGMVLKTHRPWEDNRWSFVLNVKEGSDFAWHVEFEGDKHVDTWAGG